MANIINNINEAPGVIAEMAAQMLADKVQFCKSIDKGEVSDFDGKNGYKAGDTIFVDKPARFTANTTADVSSALQDVVEEKSALTLDTLSNVPVSLTSAEVFTDLGLKSWANRILKPAISTISNDVESRFLTKAIDATYNSVGTAGSNTFNQDVMLNAAQKIYENGCVDEENQFALLNPYATRKAVTGRADLQNAPDEVSKQYKTGLMGRADGFYYLRNNLLPTHTNGTDVTGVAVNDAAVAEGASTLAVDGLTNTTGTITKGSVFTIDGVFAVHPITKDTLDHLQQFTATTDVTANGSGQATVGISPSLYAASNGLQNVSALPADNAALVFVGSASTGYAQNLAFHKSAFRMVSVPLMKPSDSHLCESRTVDGMTVRVWMQSDILTDKMIARIDFLGGLSLVRPEWACRITA